MMYNFGGYDIRHVSNYFQILQHIGNSEKQKAKCVLAVASTPTPLIPAQNNLPPQTPTPKALEPEPQQ